MSYSSGTFFSTLAGKSVCGGWDALVAYERSPLNALFAQQYVAALAADGQAPFSPMTGSITIDGNVYAYSGITLGAPQIYFPASSQSMVLTMNVIAGSLQEQGSTLSGHIVKSLTVMTAVDQYELQMTIPLSSVEGLIGNPEGQTGSTVVLDLRRAASFNTNLIDDQTGALGTSIGQPLLSLSSGAALYNIGSLVIGATGLVPTSFRMATQQPPPGGSGAAVVLAVATAYNPAGGGAPPSSPYLIPDGYGASILVRNETYVGNVLQPSYAANLPGAPTISMQSNGEGVASLVFAGSASIGVIQGTISETESFYSGLYADPQSVVIPYAGMSLGVGAATSYPLTLSWGASVPVKFIEYLGGRDWIKSSGSLSIAATITASFSVQGTSLVTNAQGSPQVSFPKQGFLHSFANDALTQIADAMGPMTANMAAIPVASFNELALTQLLFPTGNGLQLQKAKMPGDLAALADIAPASDTMVIAPLQMTLAATQSGTFTLTAPSSQQPIQWTVSRPENASIVASSDGSSAVVTITKVPPGNTLPVVVTAAGASATATAAVLALPTAIQVSPAYSLCTGNDPIALSIVSPLPAADVAWAPFSGPGTLTTSGLTATYTPPSTLPSTPQLAVIQATVTVGGATQTAGAVVALFGSEVMAVTPNVVSLSPQGTQTFTATIKSKAPSNLHWQVLPSTAGSVSTTTGIFTALTTTLPVTVVVAYTTELNVFAGIGIVINLPPS